MKNKDTLPLTLLFCESSMFMKENTGRKKEKKKIMIATGTKVQVKKMKALIVIRRSYMI